MLQVAGWTVAYGALMRLAFAPDHPGDPAFRVGRGGFQWGRVEWRLLGLAAAATVLGALAAAVVVAAYVAGALISGGFSASAPPRPSAAGLILILVAVCGTIYVALRLSLAAAATVDREELTLFRTWPVTRGQVWPLLGAHLLVGAVVVGVSLVALLGGSAIGTMAAALVGGAQAGPKAEFAGARIAVAVTAFAGAIVQAFVGLPLGVGVSAAFYRVLGRVGPPETATATAV